MAIFEIDPLTDTRWLEWTKKDRHASVFHSPAWLRALNKTYAYRPVVFTTSEPQRELQNALVFCHVRSWLTGRRLVSLPFSDHCDPVLDANGDSELFRQLQHLIKRNGLRYVELRPRHSSIEAPGLELSERYAFHAIDLRRTKDELFQALHKDSIRRKIQKAEKEGLVYEKGSGLEHLKKFYALFVMTRKRHGVPPSPFVWFQNLAESLGDSAEIRIASRGDNPVAALFMLNHNKTVVYKYGASDAQYSNLGGTPYLFWQTILEGKAAGYEELDLGRSDPDNAGLITFKDRLGGQRSDLSYWRISLNPSKSVSARRGYGLAHKVFASAPNMVTVGLGNLLYKHLG